MGMDLMMNSLLQRLCDAYNLGEIYDQPKIVRKILRSLTENFKPKVTIITRNQGCGLNSY